MSDAFETHRLTLADISRLVRKYWLLVCTVFVTGTIAMWVSLSVFFTEMYETKTRLLVKVGRENVETPATVQNGSLFSQGVRVADINSEVQMLSSQQLVEAVVDRLGPDTFKSVLATPVYWYQYPKYLLKRTARAGKRLYKEVLYLANIKKRLGPREDAIVTVAGGIEIEPVRDSDILVVMVRMPSPQLAVDVSTVLLETYMQRRLAVRQAQAGSTFFDTRVEETRQRLEELQARRAEARDQWDITAVDDQRRTALEQLAEVEAQLVQNEAEIVLLATQRDLMTDRSAALPAMNPKEQVEAHNPAIQPIEERLAQLRVEEAKVLSRYQSGSETLEKVRSEIRSLEGAIRGVQPTIVSSVTSENNRLKQEFATGAEQQAIRVEGLQRRNQYLRRAAATLREEVRNLVDGGDDLALIEQEYARAQQDYSIYAKRLEEARMSEHLDAQRVANVTAVAPPETPLQPVYPNKLFLIEVAMAMSLLLGIGLSAVVETLDDRVVDERSVTAVGPLAYLGTVQL
jgi:uncharacterized protein involved in exopolysaccharide biosynthesis